MEGQVVGNGCGYQVQLGGVHTVLCPDVAFHQVGQVASQVGVVHQNDCREGGVNGRRVLMYFGKVERCILGIFSG